MPEYRGGVLVWDYDEVLWGEQRCYHCLFRNLVELLVDGDPCCIECADLYVERMVAVGLVPSMRETLPPLWER